MGKINISHDSRYMTCTADNADHTVRWDSSTGFFELVGTDSSPRIGTIPDTAVNLPDGTMFYWRGERVSEVASRTVHDAELAIPYLLAMTEKPGDTDEQYELLRSWLATQEA